MKTERGASLLEALIGLGLLGIVAVAFFSAITTGLSGGGIVKEIYIGENLARTQMEDVKSLPFDDTNFYPVTVSPPGDYTVSVTVIDESPPEFPNTLQKIIVTVDHGERQTLQLESYKAKL